MNQKLLWQAWKIMVLLCLVLFAAGEITHSASLVDAAFNPMLAVLFFFGGLRAAAWWNRRRE